MSDSIYTSYAALTARMKLVDMIANNVANVNTSGFKRDFGWVLVRENAVEVATQSDMSTGEMMPTARDLDAAIDGGGFFVLQTPNGIRYTRSGSFSVNDAGELVTKDGLKVMSSSNSTINVGEGKVRIDDGGTVFVDEIEAARIRIVDFKDLSKLQKEGLSRWQYTGDPPDVVDVPEPRVKGGFLERSNVSAVEEMVRMLAVYREFESLQRTMKTVTTDLNEKLIQQMGTLS